MATKPNIRELLVESVCEHNETKQKTGNTPTPGATTGSWAFEGAQIVLFPFADAAHLLEEPSIRVLSTLSGDGHIAAVRTAHSTKLNVIVCANSLV